MAVSKYIQINNTVGLKVPTASGGTTLGTGTAGQVLTSGGSNGVYWATPDSGGSAVTLNGSSTKNASFYAPTAAGTSGQFLKSNGANKAPTWVAQSVYHSTIAQDSDLFVTTTANQKTYTVTQYHPGAIYNVYVNGFKIPNEEYSVSSSGVVTMQNPPELANQEVEVTATYIAESLAQGEAVNTSYMTWCRQTTAPTNINCMWVDTSVSPNKVKFYNGSAWESLNSWQ